MGHGVYASYRRYSIYVLRYRTVGTAVVARVPQYVAALCKVAAPSSPAEGWANLTTRVFYSKLVYTVASIDTHSMYRLKIREWEIHI